MVSLEDVKIKKKNKWWEWFKFLKSFSLTDFNSLFVKNELFDMKIWFIPSKIKVSLVQNYFTSGLGTFSKNFSRSGNKLRKKRRYFRRTKIGMLL